MMRDSQRPPKANFFLVGAPKAGTTSVDRVLRRHGEVFLSPIKEPCHFCPDINAQIAPVLNRKDRIDLQSYLASPQRDVVHLAHVAQAGDYARLFEGAAGSRIVGECSTYYLSSKVAPGAIHAYNPEAKILVLVRDPLQRIRSHYAMDRTLGLATRPLLALVEEELALGDRADWGNSRYYVGASRYARQLAEYRRHFDESAICVLAFEDLVADTDRTLRRLFGFLDIAAPDGTLTLPLENKSRGVRFPRLHHGLRESGLKPIVASMLKGATGTRLGRMATSMYYREKQPVASDKELHRLAVLLREEGLEPAGARMDVEAA